MDSAEYTIRRALNSDLDTIMAIEERAYQPPWTKQQFQDCFNDRYEINMVEKDNLMVAYWVLQPILDELHILNFCVNPDMQGLGLGKKFLAEVIHQATVSGMSRILLEVRRSNKAARALYKASDFEFMGIRKNYYPTTDAHREDAITMQLLLGD